LNVLDIITLKECYKKSNTELLIYSKDGKMPTLFKEDFEENKKSIVKKLNKIRDLGIITYWDDEYPDLLKNINDPPVILYYFGDISLLKSKTVSIVGTRKPTEYGKSICEEIVKNLNGYTIVSGMAYGIDSIAQKRSKKTIAVLGNGIDIIYPKSNESLYNKIKKEGLIISEYFPETRATRYTFPYRNRIIAGLSERSIVVEAAKKSGSLITARYALDYGREVLAVPGDITRINSYGTNYLIYSGATPVISMEQLREMFGYTNLEGQYFSGKEENTDLENKILKLILDGKNTLDLICDSLKEDVSSILSLLMQLEMDGKIGQENGTYFYMN
jgi:DNA processing protein